MARMTPLSISVMRTLSALLRRMHQPSTAAFSPALRQMSTTESIVNKKLDGKVAIITGAAGGIGSAAARMFAAHGAQVILADIADENGHIIASKIGSSAHYRHCDVTNEEDVASTVDFAVERFGKLDIMYNNAGRSTGLASLETLNMDDYDRYTSVNVRGLVVGIKHAARVMIPVKQGLILNTASTASVFAGSSAPLVYNINKMNLPGLTRVAACHLGKHGIRVNAISPHAVYNSLVVDWLAELGIESTAEAAEQAFIRHSSLLGKRCTEEDIAKGALFLCSDDSGYVSGQNLLVDGGWCYTKEYDLSV